ncbi:MAG TPA: carbamoyltransferase HypF [Chloroflexi bacterium]|nr:carbamoyltransferase HypF [Chloroflexota bacterium]
MNDRLATRRIHITGVVQGVGFRPFVYNLATRLGVSGWVLNSSSGVEIEAAAPAAVLDEFVRRLRTDAPPLARIETITVTECDPATCSPETLRPGFTIRHSEARPGEFQPISPDIAICEDCLRELFDPNDRRYRYPFINCTNCGPRFTIIKDIPYDRPNTTMAPFKMCPDCQAEYDNPTDRRFHAQPNACPVCGPKVWLDVRSSEFDVETPNSELGTPPDAPIQAARQLLREGAIVAIKGLGGFHLACDATNDEAVARLRERKGRVDKPFAIMAFDLETVEQFCEVNDAERALLTSRERPIVLLRRKPNTPISPLVAPNNRYLGVMLPYTPLHYLLLEPTDGFPIALVMTSGNYSEEPIAIDNDEALERLSRLADAFLLHDRDIHARCDDSVVRIFQGEELPIRRSRGYAPYPIHLPFDLPQVLAVGAELKNTFCLTRDRYAFLSQHIGDMENYETLRFFEQMVEQLARTFRVRPEIIAHDMHPGYLTTRYAQERKRGSQEARGTLRLATCPLFPVQHHHAHIAACMAENGLSGERPVIGVAFDGTGYGTDGAIWGGEFLVADYRSFRRAAHLKYVPLPGGDTAIRRPYRTALAHLWAAGIPWEEDLSPVAACPPAERAILARQLERGLNVVPTSSIGRLFDAVSALAGVRQTINYEAQAAIELEMTTDEEVTEAYGFAMTNGQLPIRVDPAPVIRAVVADVRAGVPAGIIAARFHNGLAQMIRDVCLRLREATGIDEVALSGGVFQNITLLEKALSLLRDAGFTVYTHRLVPPNDAGISLGQAVIAGVTAREREQETQ